MTPEEGSTCVHPRPAHFFERLFCVCLDILSFFFLFFTRVHIFEQGVWKALPVQSLGCFSFMRALPSYLGGIYLINLTTQMLEFHHVYLTLVARSPLYLGIATVPNLCFSDRFAWRDCCPPRPVSIVAVSENKLGG